MIPPDPDDGFSIDDRLFDRLADGEMGDEDRQALLARLDTEPEGWRRCALALLEAQELRSVLRSYRAEIEPSAPLRALAPVPRRGRPIVARLAQAAAVLVAFALGAISSGRGAGHPSSISHPEAPAITRNRPLPVVPKPLPKLAALPVRPAVQTPEQKAQARLEREGYAIERRMVLVPIDTKGGQRYAVPAEEVKVRFVGNQTL